MIRLSEGEAAQDAFEQAAAAADMAAALAAIRGMIDGGKLPADGRLPPERDLAAELGCGRRTVRRALDTLPAQVVSILEYLKDESGPTLIVIARDLAVIRHISDHPLGDALRDALAPRD